MSPAPRPPAPPRDWAGRRVLVMGLGRFGGGAGAARHLASAGARVLVTDTGAPETLRASLDSLEGLEIELVLGEHRERDFDRAEVVVVNPAVPPDHPLLARARAAGALLTTEIELFLAACRGRAVCVTGTQGKSSTCHVLATLLEHTGTRAHLGGNIGGSLLESLEQIGPADVVVLELSSYQLEALGEPRALAARVAAVAITNVLADHLERHASEERYAQAKARILELCRAGTVAFLPGEDPRLWRDPLPGVRRVAHWEEGARPGAPGLVFDEDSFRLGGEVLGRPRDLLLPGRFQRKNAALALGLARVLGTPAGALAGALGRVRGLPHRLEDLGRVAGRRVWDNGVSTTPDSTLAALVAVAPGCTLLVGGSRKRLDYGALCREVARRGARAVAFGDAGEGLGRELAAAGAEVEVVPDFEEAVRRAFQLTPDGGELLFSPACASFDAFPNFQARARLFRALLTTVTA